MSRTIIAEVLDATRLWHKQGKTAQNQGKMPNIRQKLKKRAEILAQEKCQKQGNHLKRGTLTPLSIAHP